MKSPFDATGRFAGLDEADIAALTPERRAQYDELAAAAKRAVVIAHCVLITAVAIAVRQAAFAVLARLIGAVAIAVLVSVLLRIG